MKYAGDYNATTTIKFSSYTTTKEPKKLLFTIIMKEGAVIECDFKFSTLLANNAVVSSSRNAFHCIGGKIEKLGSSTNLTFSNTGNKFYLSFEGNTNCLKVFVNTDSYCQVSWNVILEITVLNGSIISVN